MTALETSRLCLRPLELSDAQQTQVLFPQWEIVRFLTNSVPWPYPPDGAVTYYRNIALPAMARGEAWHWTLRLKSNPDQLIGSISLMRSADENRGFWLGIPWQKQGLMSEACETITDFWFNVLEFPRVRVSKAVPNEASRRISEKQRMRLIAKMERNYVGGRFPAELWEITAEEWSRRKVLPQT
ncbi:MAG: GNAT family N-acetyltransferase [Acidobacteriaceae bacterium]|nr:GNAT family N-acetyltransferase [Acidobacteriaceae bacterium]